MDVISQSHIKNAISFPIQNVQSFKYHALRWAAQFDIYCYLDNNGYNQYKYNDYECLIAVDAIDELNASDNDPFDELKKVYQKKQDWLFGFLTYDLKNKIILNPKSHQPLLRSDNYDHIQMPEIHFFQPRYVIEIKKDLIHGSTVIIHTHNEDAEKIYKEITKQDINQDVYHGLIKTLIKHRIPKQQYLDTINKIKEHIVEGDVYEMNFCQEFFAGTSADFDPTSVFMQLNAMAKAPFSAFYKLKDKYLICTSPERFLKKKGDKLISQPIKGTIKRSSNPAEDDTFKKQLKNSTKDRAENIMIVDLVRNDLARSSKAGTVKVEELFGIYSFSQVHHMISTVISELREDVHFTDVIKNAFPMGSMTGAPKIAAMQLIEEYEQTRRGLFSGSVGYITPYGDFDFNVVIRSMLYNAADRYLSFQAGGAITYDSVPEQEYEESLLKAKSMIEVLST